MEKVAVLLSLFVHNVKFHQNSLVCLCFTTIYLFRNGWIINKATIIIIRHTSSHRKQSYLSCAGGTLRYLHLSVYIILC